MKTGPECLHYISQHRKLCDDLICITQAVANVDKQFRSIAQDFSLIRNEYAAKFGIFKGRGRFLRKSYNEFQPEGSTRQEPFETASFQIDCEGVASCYNTSAGVGIENKGEPDKLKRAKGISTRWIWVGLVAVVLFSVVVPRLVNAALMSKVSDGVSTPAQPSDAQAPSSLTLSDSPPPPVASEPSPAIPIYLTGVWKMDGVYNLTLSDGRRFDTDVHSHRIDSIDREKVTIDGRDYYWKQHAMIE